MGEERGGRAPSTSRWRATRARPSRSPSFSVAMAAGAGAPAVHDGPGRRRGPGRAAVRRLVERLDRRRAGRRRRPRGQARRHRAPARSRRSAPPRSAPPRPCVVLSLALGWRAGLVHLATVASAWAYNAAAQEHRAGPGRRTRSRSASCRWPSRWPCRAQPVAAWWAMAAGALLGHRCARRQRGAGPAGRPGHRRARAAAPGGRDRDEHRHGAGARRRDGPARPGAARVRRARSPPARSSLAVGLTIVGHRAGARAAGATGCRSVRDRGRGGRRGPAGAVGLGRRLTA